MSTTYRKKLIEVALPLEAINAGAVEEKSVPRHGHPQSLHLWWARRPLAAARAILFAQLVDDPSSRSDLFPTEEAQNEERQRLFRLMEDLVLWKNTSNDTVINAARLEIARSHARCSFSPKAKDVLATGVKAEVVNDYLATELPPVHDPFAGGGTIPLEAQRLGLRAIATDLNPVAVMINRALIEIPPRFSGMPPVNPEARENGKLRMWDGAEGLAEDVRRYGEWMLGQAQKRIGRLYPEVELPADSGTGSVVAWLWARTVESPNPAFRGCRVPLASSFLLSSKEGKEAWVCPVIEGRSYRFTIKSGKPSERVSEGTKLGRGANFRCLLSETPIEPDYVKSEGRAGRLGSRLMAVVVEGKKGRIYIEPTEEMEALAASASPQWTPDEPLPNDPRNFWTVQYGLTRFSDLFTPRQLTTLTTFCDLLGEVRSLVCSDAASARTGTADVATYADAVTTYLAFCVSKMADWCSAVCGFIPGYGKYRDTFARQAIPMTWDYAELNPFGEAVGNWRNHVEWVSDAIAASPRNVVPGTATLGNAEDFDSESVVSTDPPYYDNIGYADLSDFFYVWLRRSLRQFYPEVFSTVLAPKDRELVASPYRHGGRDEAERFFLEGMRRVLERFAERGSDYAPSAIYYAFRQSEMRQGGTSSTGWETFLSAIVEAGHSIEATIPIRTEREGRSNSHDTNALASSIVLVCRKRLPTAPTTTRGEFRRMLRKELPEALKRLQQGNIAPVDVAQASIGPGIAIFSRHKQVVEADATAMTVRSALQLINEVLDEYLSSGEGDFDADTRFAITWYEQHGWEPGVYGDAETLAKARNVSVDGVEHAGIIEKGGGKVRILKRHEMRPLDYDPAHDEHPTVWEFTQHMIRNLEDEGEEAAARLLKQLGGATDATRELAYRLYNTCERKKWAEDARSYNALILAWTELEKLAAKMGDEPPPGTPGNGGKANKRVAGQNTKGTKKQQSLFQGNDG